MSDCLFCGIVDGSVPSTKVADTGSSYAFRDLNPVAPVHVLVIPRAHVASLNDLANAEVVAHMHALAVQVAKAEGIDQRGFRTVINTNDDGGQTVFHLHMHVLGGRRMSWPPG